MIVICQFGAVCLNHCKHKWPHARESTAGCSLRGCDTPNIGTDRGLRDEFGEFFVRYNLTPAYCVDFEYFMSHTGRGHVIVTKGTVFEGYKKHSETHKKQMEDQIQLQRLRQQEKERQWITDRTMEACFRQLQSQIDLNLLHNPSLVEEEDAWTGRNYGNWG